MIQHFLPFFHWGQGAFLGQRDTFAVDKDVSAIILEDEAIPLPEIEPLDAPMKLAAVLDPLGAGIAQIRAHNLEALIGHLALLFHGKNELLATLLAGDECVAKIHRCS